MNFLDEPQGPMRSSLIRPIVFTDLLSQAHRRKILSRAWAAIPYGIAVSRGKELVIADTDIDRLPNVFDFALGQKQVKEKLDRVVTKTKQELATNPGTSIEQAAEKVLHGPTDAALARFREEAGPDWKIELIRPERMSVQAAFRRLARPENLRTFFEGLRMPPGLSKEYDQPLYGPAHRIMMAEMAAEDVEFNTFGTVMDKLRHLRFSIEHSATLRNLDPAQDIFVVGSGGSASSETLMTYMYALKNRIAPNRIHMRAEIEQHPERFRGNRLVLIDDAIHSGQQARSTIKVLEQLDLRSDVAVAALSANHQFARQFAKFSPIDSELLTLQTDFNLRYPKNPFFKLQPPGDSKLLAELFDEFGYAGVINLKVQPYMASDAVPDWLWRFAKKFLSVPSATEQDKVAMDALLSGKPKVLME